MTSQERSLVGQISSSQRLETGNTLTGETFGWSATSIGFPLDLSIDPWNTELRDVGYYDEGSSEDALVTGFCLFDDFAS